MAVVVFPRIARTACRRSFWLAASLVAGGSVAIAGALASSATAAVAGAALLAALLGLDALWPPATVLAYRAWNRAARAYARVARRWVMVVCYATVVAAVGQVGARLDRGPGRPGGGPAWTERRTQPLATYGSQSDMRLGVGARSWRSAVLRWACASRRNAWAVALLPFLVLLSALSDEEDTPMPANIYTLF